MRTLYRICGHQGLIPTSLEVPLCYDPATTAQCHGGFGDVWKARHYSQDVAAKALRVSLSTDFKQTKKVSTPRLAVSINELTGPIQRFCREVTLWKSLCHPNVLPLLGVTMTETRFVMVSEWMENGNINEFTKARADVNLFELVRSPGPHFYLMITIVRLPQLEDVTRGLIYMHDQGIVHGDLKGVRIEPPNNTPHTCSRIPQPNVLVDRNGHACISDFSLLTIVSDQQTFLASSMTGGTIPWMSPELLDPERFGLDKSRLTKESDRYALGMVVYETLSGWTPFAPHPPAAVMMKVLNGDRPGRPQGSRRAWFGDGVWAMLDLCWKPKPHERPSLDTILQCLQGASRPSRPTSRNDEVQTNANGQQGPATANDSSTFPPLV